MKVLLTGSSGQLGKEIIKLKPNGINLITSNRSELDLETQSHLRSILRTRSQIG